MTEQLRFRIERTLAEEAEEVCHEIGITPTAAVSMFFAQMVKLRGLPFRPSDFPALEEYGATLMQATTAENKALHEIAAERKAGKLKTVAALPSEVRLGVTKAITRVGAGFGDPHRQRGLGLRKLGRRSYEIRGQKQWRVELLHDGENLIAHDVMNHAEVARWLRGQR